MRNAFNKDSYWVNSGFYMFMDRIFTLLFGFGSFFILVRHFSKDDFGTWTLFVSITTLVEMARNGLVQNAQIKFLTSGSKKEYPQIVTASFAMNGIFTFVTIVLLLVGSQLLTMIWKAPELELMFYYYIFTTTVLILSSQFDFIQQANLSFKGIFYNHIIRHGLFFAYILINFLSGSGLNLYGLVKFQILAAIIGCVVAYFFTRRYLKISYSISSKWLRKLFNYGKYVFGTNISSIIYKSIDQMFLGALVSTASVAIYNTAVRISNLVEVPTGSISSIVFPKSAQRMETGGKPAVKYLYERSVGLILAMILPGVLLVLLFPDFIILIVAGEKYLDTIPILRVTILYTLFVPFARQFGTVLDSIGKPKINFFFVALGTVLNIIFNYLFIKKFGTIGAAYGTLISYGICFIINQLVLSRILKVETFNVLLYARKFYMDAFYTTTRYLKGVYPRSL